MTTEKQLTLSDLERLPREILLRALLDRAGVNEGTLYSKLSRFRKGIPDALGPDQAERLKAALRELWEELGEVIGEGDDDRVL